MMFTQLGKIIVKLFETDTYQVLISDWVYSMRGMGCPLQAAEIKSFRNQDIFDWVEQCKQNYCVRPLAAKNKERTVPEKATCI